MERLADIRSHVGTHHQPHNLPSEEIPCTIAEQDNLMKTTGKGGGDVTTNQID
mgnify:CR=1 FL=1